MKLRGYQESAVNAAIEYYDSRINGNCIIVAPTGSGKSIIIAELINRLTKDNRKALMVTHSKELIRQNAEKILRMHKHIDIGIYSSGLNYKHTNNKVIYCGIQSVHNKAKSISNKYNPVDLVIIDECHKVPFNENTTYRKFLADLKEINSNIKVIGLTATPWRWVNGNDIMTGGYELLTKGENNIFDDVIYDISKDLESLIDSDYLSPLWPASTDYSVDLSGLHTRFGEYIESELDQLMSDDKVVNSICLESAERARIENRNHWIVFCSSVNQAERMNDKFNSIGVNSSVLTDKTGARERDFIVNQFALGKLKCLINVNILSTGFDAPNIDLIICARPTISPIFYVQMMGRGMRVNDYKLQINDKTKQKNGCMVLDFVGNVEKHGPIDKIKIKSQNFKKPQPLKECPDCEWLLPINIMTCPKCGFEFKSAIKDDSEQPAINDLAIISFLDKEYPYNREYSVTSVSYSKHLGKSGYNSIRVDYQYHDGKSITTISKWQCLDHPQFTFPKSKAIQWFRYVCDGFSVPDSVNQFFEWLDLGMPVRKPSTIVISVCRNKKDNKIIKLNY